MKTGKRTRLSEKLNAELDTIRAEHFASISSQLKSFRIDFKNIVGAAQHTIASDTRRYQTETARMFETWPSSIRRWLRISPWLIAAMVLNQIGDDTFGKLVQYSSISIGAVDDRAPSMKYLSKVGIAASASF